MAPSQYYRREQSCQVVHFDFMGAKKKSTFIQVLVWAHSKMEETTELLRMCYKNTFGEISMQHS